MNYQYRLNTILKHIRWY